jgi:hypothetical protein
MATAEAAPMGRPFWLVLPCDVRTSLTFRKFDGLRFPVQRQRLWLMPRSTLLDLEKCRALLGTDCKLTDSQLEQLRQEIYVLSDVVLESFCAQKLSAAGRTGKSQNISGCLNGIPHPEREAVEERAAILEFERGLNRPEAERQVFGEWVQSTKPADYFQKQRRKNPRRARKPKLTQKH